MTTNQKITVLNPFSVSLKKPPFMQVDTLVYTNGEYRIYKYTNEHYVYTYKNIVFSERGGANKDFVNNLAADVKPTGEAALYHDYERPKQAIKDGVKAANKLKFQIK
ncbi:MAG: hypothetical protein V4538_15400 [Bacteroidota bacterium]